MSNFNVNSQTVAAPAVSSRLSVIRSLPFLLVYIRLMITIALLIDATDRNISSWFIPMLCCAVFLDGIDGALARRLGVVTKRLREADSTLDFAMMVSFVICCWLTHRAEIVTVFPWLVLFIAVNLLSFLPALRKYGSLPPYHTYSARLTGVFLFVSALELFSANRVGIFMSVALGIGFISHLDRVAITLILPHPPSSDVKGFWHALQIRDHDF